MVRRGREAGSQAVAGGAPLICQLFEEETMRWPFDEGGIEEEATAHRFCYSCSTEGGARQHLLRWRDGRVVVTSVTEGGRRSWDGPSWAEVGRADRVAAGPVLVKTKENGVGCSMDFGPN
jgi:hypothetical protein